LSLELMKVTEQDRIWAPNVYKRKYSCDVCGVLTSAGTRFKYSQRFTGHLCSECAASIDLQRE
jgi:hypothetical protein